MKQFNNFFYLWTDEKQYLKSLNILVHVVYQLPDKLQIKYSQRRMCVAMLLRNSKHTNQ